MSGYGARTVKRRRRSNVELGMIDDAIVEAVAEDHPVTLRGVYYRVVSAGAVEKTEVAYRLVGRELLKLRRAGTIPYSHITDGTRWITKPGSWSSLDQMLEDSAISYRRALWHDQPTEIHIFTEKDAVSGVVLPVTETWDVPLGVLRGYASESFVHSVAEVIERSSKGFVYIYQLGDHDPSGVDAWRAFREGVKGFLGEAVTREMATRAARLRSQITYEFVGSRRGRGLKQVTFARLAVNPDQIRQLHLPTRPTKQSDTRSRGFVGGSVEVDAIPAPTLRQIVETAITSHIDGDAWARLQEVEELERQSLIEFVSAWRSGRS